MPKLSLTSTEDETDRIRVFHFEEASGTTLPGYTAGAHIDVDLGASGTRSYSLIDWPGAASKGYALAVQREDDGQGGSQAMHALAPGDQIATTDPVNDFELASGVAPVLLLGGGIGITPLISMATELQAQDRPFALHYSARSEAVMGFASRLKETFGSVVHLYFDDTNPLDLPALMAAQPKDTQLYICGPKGMIDAARSAADAADLADIHVELFSTPDAQDTDVSFEVEINDGQVFVIPPGKSIIEVLEDAGVDLMYDCQRGDCGICQTDVIRGTPDHRDVVLSDEERASGSVMQICVSRAKSDRLVLDI